MLNSEDLTKLSAPFGKEILGVKVQAYNNREREKATKCMLVLYLQHTDVAARLDAVDPSWSFLINDIDKKEKTVFVKGTLKIKGSERENYGEGDDPKSAASDALKRCAMLFGVGRSLYDSDQVWVDFNYERDRYKHFSFEEYWAKARK